MKYIKKYENLEEMTFDKDDDRFAVGRLFHLENIDPIEPILRGLIRDSVNFDFYYAEDPQFADGYSGKLLISFLILLKDRRVKNFSLSFFPSTEQKKIHIHLVNRYEVEEYNWVKVNDVEAFLDMKKYNL